jgi:hypothetical protein
MSPDAISFMEKGIRDSTRQSYGAPVRRYMTHYKLTGFSPAAFTVNHIVNWFAHLGMAGDLSPATLSTYRSALGRWYLEKSSSPTGTTGINPVHDARVSEVLKGIERVWLATPRIKVITPSLTPNLLSQLRPHMSDKEPRATMVWAAATLGVGAILRPSEILGSPVHPDRALRADQIAFYKSKDSAQVIGLLPPFIDIDRVASPDRYEVRLSITKTTKGESVKVVSGEAMVHALWRWCHLRRSLGITSPFLFVDEDDKRLSIAALIAELQVGFTGLGQPNVKLTGKCFRRGGASFYVNLGLTNQEVAAIGGWKSSSMVNTYADAASKTNRQIMHGRLVDTAISSLRH